MKTITLKETTKIIKQELKDNFAGVKFSVTSQKYSMGNSVNISYENGPTKEAVRKVVSKFEGATFDGREDLQTLVKSIYKGEEVRFESKYIHINRY